MLLELIDDTSKVEESILYGAKSSSGRFQDAHWYNPHLRITIGGVGGIGSWLSLFLARQECVIDAYDMDTVSDTNIGGQLYSVSHINQLKTSAMQGIIKDYTDSYAYTGKSKFEKDSKVSAFTFSAFDNMATRKLMFEQWKLIDDENKIFIDGRLELECGQIFAVVPGREARYEAELFEDSEIEDPMCSMKATSHCGAMIAGYMTAAFNNHIANKMVGMDIREVPFKYTFELPMFSTSIIK